MINAEKNDLIGWLESRFPAVKTPAAIGLTPQEVSSLIAAGLMTKPQPVSVEAAYAEYARERVAKSSKKIADANRLARAHAITAALIAKHHL